MKNFLKKITPSKILGIIISIGIGTVAIAFLGTIMLLTIGTVVLTAVGVSAPAVVKTMIYRHKLGKRFRKECKAQGIIPNMKEFNQDKDRPSFLMDVGAHAFELICNIRKNNQKLHGLREARETISNHVIQEQLKYQAELQKTIYGFTFGDKDIYLDATSEYSEEYERKLNQLRISYPHINFWNSKFKLYYVGDYEGRSMVVKKTTPTNTEHFTLGEVTEFHVPSFNSWALDFENQTDTEQIRKIYIKKGITALKTRKKS